MRASHGLRLAPILLAAACGSDPTPSPSPSVSPTAVACTGTPQAYAKAVVESWIPACSLAQNIYNDPKAALGPPDAAGFGPTSYSGFISLGFGGHVTLDLGGCISDGPGNDIRVYQAVSSEAVTVYVSTGPDGPWTLVEALKECGAQFHGIQNYCEFDLAKAGVTQARYVRVEDGELFPCPGGTKTEGADLDAVQALGVSTSSAGRDER